MAYPALLRLALVPSRHESVRRVDDHPIPFPTLVFAHNTVSTPNSKGELSVDPSVVWNTLMSASHWAQFFSGRPGPGFSPPANCPKHHSMGQPLIGRPLYGPRKEEASFADGRLNALALCLLESLRVRHG